jgi:hypothetical protein
MQSSAERPARLEAGVSVGAMCLAADMVIFASGLLGG